MKDTGERRSVFRKGKGRAFLRFLVGEMVLVVLVSVVYLFILQGDIPLPKTPAGTAAPGVQATDVPQDAPDVSTASPVPTAAVTLEPTAEPTPAPTGTPIPFEELSLPASGAQAPEIPEVADETLKLGLQEFQAFCEAEQSVLAVGGYAYIEGLDAAKSTIYLVIGDAGSGDILNLYPAVSAPENANLSFEESSGENLSQAFFTARIDVSEYMDGAYMLMAVVSNGNRVLMNYFDDRTFHFLVQEGVLSIVE